MRAGPMRIEVALDRQALPLEDGVEQAVGLDQGASVILADETRLAGFMESRLGCGSDQRRMLCAVSEHQGLRDEIEIRQAALGELEIPRIVVALLLRDELAHGADLRTRRVSDSRLAATISLTASFTGSEMFARRRAGARG